MRLRITLLIAALLALVPSVHAQRSSGGGRGGNNNTVATYQQTAQTANVAAYTIYTTPSSGGVYRLTCHIVLTTAATTSSTLPNCGVSYTDFYSGGNNPAGTITFTSTNTGNLVGESQQNGSLVAGNITLYAKGGTAINVGTYNYATSGATAMVYSVIFTLEKIG